ncbi:MAG TPA: YHS domain-containing protein, partial [Pirellulaceae bacterium]|nr:YHS domain-containing protein [Pirellulaceae bacterium]
MDLIQIGKPPEGDEEPAGGVEIDPVCGMRVEPAKAAGKFDYGGRTYYFCARSCLEKFRADPAAYLSQEKSSRRPAPAG